MTTLTVFHALVSIPEHVVVDEWSKRHDLAEWAGRGKGWSEYREPLRSVLGPPPHRRHQTLTVDAATESEARARLVSAVAEVGGDLLSVVYPAELTPEITELKRLTDDLLLDGSNYLREELLSADRAGDLAGQASEVGTLYSRLCTAGYGAHPVAVRAQTALEVTTRALAEHEPFPGVASAALDACRLDRGRDV